jgi:hypothetical protein
MNFEVLREKKILLRREVERMCEVIHLSSEFENSFSRENYEKGEKKRKKKVYKISNKQNSLEYHKLSLHL